MFFAWFVFLDWFHWFQLIVLLKPDCNYLSSFTLSWVDKITTGIYSFVSLIVNVGTWLATATKKQSLDHFNWRLILLLIKDTWSVIQICATFSCLSCYLLFNFERNTFLFLLLLLLLLLLFLLLLLLLLLLFIIIIKVNNIVILI